MIGLIVEIGQIAAAIGALAGLITLLWKYWLSPQAKARKLIIKEGKKAIDDRDISKITRIIDKLSVFILLALLTMAGCGSAKHMHPITDLDIIILKKGEAYTAPESGFFLSDEYFKHVMGMKLVK